MLLAVFWSTRCQLHFETMACQGRLLTYTWPGMRDMAKRYVHLLVDMPTWPMTPTKGNMFELFNRQHGPQYHLDLVEKYDRVARVNGFFGVRTLRS